MLENVLGFSVTASRPEVSERRREPRFECEALPGQLRVGSVTLPARVMDISRSGVRVEVGMDLSVSSEVTLSFEGYIVAGRVRYCRRNDSGSYDVGLQLEDVLYVI